ncbi:6-hydroxymethylpterin diphosphokinase MptE-like protein [Halorutilales archaeon Cl-col2-1]
MEFEDWEPLYEAILEDLGYSRDDDLASAKLLDSYLDPFDLGRLGSVIEAKDVYVVGNAPCLEDEIHGIPDPETEDTVVVAADAASERLSEAGVDPDVVCTDLDGSPSHAADLSQSGTVVAVHSHGDNTDLIERWIEEFDLSNTLGTTQTRPLGDVHNFGGFTDGDRCAFVADEFGADSLSLVGFDFDDPSVSPEKSRKLDWARRLIRVLEKRRDERIIEQA